ncbi:uncharacterized protein LOC124189701 isoform X1 [Daphnia pulex]|uniref:uncharacterized protein LOC124189671 isoform X1 n=2 Tax=Daphnia pulex TaxID=6669 RepID=UPI001EE020A6|nr:uncharacterized protein LOC124189671 isoform X1 [Daphnia pulex]XP_046438096.1 uncharacterized protein LOC124189701 isoform X1 [Daphnia pulex]
MSSTNMIISLVSVSTVVIFAGLFASWCVRTIRTLIKSPSKSELKLQGLPVQPTLKDGQPESMRFQRRIQSTMAAFIENGMDDELAPLVVSRLEWCNQINRYLDMLKNTPESIESVANGIEVLMNYHQLHRSEAEQDLVDAIFSRALKNGNISHLYAKLLKRLRSGDQQKGWTQNIVRLLFQLAVEEFNRPLDSDDENGKSRLEKFNNVKLMAAIFKREMPGVPDGWITDCAETLIYRLETGVTEESVKQLCLFLTTLLIAEPGENCDSITPTRQRQLLTCFEALERAATSPKVPQQPDVKIQKSDATTQTLKPESEESDTDTSTDESDTDSETNGLEPAEIRTNSASASDNRMN